MDEKDPIEASIDWLTKQGFTRDEARNLCRAIRASSPEKLWADAPLWLEWCGKIKQEHDCIVMLAAMGMIFVEIGPGGIEDLRLGLKDGVRPATAGEIQAYGGEG
jgi:hypothetical protein